MFSQADNLQIKSFIVEDFKDNAQIYAFNCSGFFIWYRPLTEAKAQYDCHFFQAVFDDEKN